jgi:exopolysaccharide biosynthesis protein
MDDANETQYIEMILSIIDYDFIRRTDKGLENRTDNYIKHLILTAKDDIIVSQTHAKLIAQNNLFDYEFYKSHYPELANMNPTNVLNHYLIYGKDRKDIISHEHAQYLTNTPYFNIDVYKSHHLELYHICPLKLVNHYNGFGKKENRQCN